MRHAMAASLAILICAVPVKGLRADWEYAKWGMTPEQVAAGSRGAVTVIPIAKRKRLDEIKLENAAEGTYTDGPLNLRVSFSFSTERGGLAMVGYGVLDQAQNGLLKDWLIRKYGQPQSSGGLPIIGLETFHWGSPDEIDLSISKGDSAFVMHSPVSKN